MTRATARQRVTSLLAAMASLSIVIGGCGSDEAAVRTVTVEHTTPAAAPDTPAALDPGPQTTTSPSSNRPVAPAFVRCDGAITVKQNTTTCAFANNAFYAYWTSGEAHRIRAYSPAAGRVFSTQCSARDARVECSTSDGGALRFPQAAVDRYSQAQADAYAANHDLGPDPSSGGAAPVPEATPPPPPPVSAAPGTSTDFCTTRDCIPNYPNGNGSTVQCADGSYSQSGGIQGACSHHGGVG